MTIKDIAKLAGVSVSTVSRVLNDRPDVSEDSRRRVRAVIEAHKYVPNNSARDLVKVRSDAIGLVVRGVQNPFYTDIIHAIEQKLDASGYTMVMRQIPSGDDEIQCGAVMEKEAPARHHFPRRAQRLFPRGGCASQRSLHLLFLHELLRYAAAGLLLLCFHR